MALVSIGSIGSRPNRPQRFRCPVPRFPSPCTQFPRPCTHGCITSGYLDIPIPQHLNTLAPQPTPQFAPGLNRFPPVIP